MCAWLQWSIFTEVIKFSFIIYSTLISYYRYIKVTNLGECFKTDLIHSGLMRTHFLEVQWYSEKMQEEPHEVLQTCEQSKARLCFDLPYISKLYLKDLAFFFVFSKRPYLNLIMFLEWKDYRDRRFFFILFLKKVLYHSTFSMPPIASSFSSVTRIPFLTSPLSFITLFNPAKWSSIPTSVLFLESILPNPQVN